MKTGGNRCKEYLPPAWVKDTPDINTHLYIQGRDVEGQAQMAPHPRQWDLGFASTCWMKAPPADPHAGGRRLPLPFSQPRSTAKSICHGYPSPQHSGDQLVTIRPGLPTFSNPKCHLSEPAVCWANQWSWCPVRGGVLSFGHSETEKDSLGHGNVQLS